MSTPQATPWGPVAAVLLCLLPIALLLLVTLLRRLSLPSSTSLPLAAALLALIRLGYFNCPPQLVFASVVKGVLEALTPLSVIYGAILLFETMQHTKCLPWMMRRVKSLSAGQPLAEVFLIGWAFAFMISGVGGFNTPIALAAPMLASLGHDPVKSIISVVIFSTLASHYGSVGISIWFGFSSLGLSQAELLKIGLKASTMLAAISLVIGPIAAAYLIGWRPVLRGSMFVVLSIVSAVLPMALLAMVSTEFPVLLGGLSGIICTAALAFLRLGLCERPAASVAALPWLVHPPRPAVPGFKAVVPAWQYLKKKVPGFRLTAIRESPEAFDGIVCISDIEMPTMSSASEQHLHFRQQGTASSRCSRPADSSQISSSSSSSSSSSTGSMEYDTAALHPVATSTASFTAASSARPTVDAPHEIEAAQTDVGARGLARFSCPAALTNSIYHQVEVLHQPDSSRVAEYAGHQKDSNNIVLAEQCPSATAEPELPLGAPSGPLAAKAAMDGNMATDNEVPDLDSRVTHDVTVTSSSDGVVLELPGSLAAALFAATIHHAALDGVSRQPWSSSSTAAIGQRHAWQQRQQHHWQQHRWRQRYPGNESPGFEHQVLDYSGTEIPAIDVAEPLQPASEEIDIEDSSFENSDATDDPEPDQGVELCCSSVKDQPQGIHSAGKEKHHTSMVLARRALLRTLPLWLTLLLLLVTRVQQLKIQDILQSTSPSLTLHLGSLGTFCLSPSLVVQLQHLLSVPELEWRYEVLYVPCVLPFVVTCLVTMALHSRQLKTHGVRWTWPFYLAWKKLTCTIISMIGAMVLSQLLSTGAVDSPAYIIGYYLSHWLGRGYLGIAGLLGALGTFISGSTMTANITFGTIQQVAAENMGVPVSTVLAIHVLGSCAGKMVCINNILSVKAMMDVQEMDEGMLMRKVIPVLTVFIVLAEAAGLVLGLSGVW